MGAEIGSVVLQAVAAKIVGNILSPSSSPSAPPAVTPTPKPPEPTVIEQPDPLAQNVEARKKNIVQMQQSGRASTILTDNTNTLGG